MLNRAGIQPNEIEIESSGGSWGNIPLPFCSLVVHAGPPMHGARITVDECQSAIESLEEERRGNEGKPRRLYG